MQNASIIFDKAPPLLMTKAKNTPVFQQHSERKKNINKGSSVSLRNSLSSFIAHFQMHLQTHLNKSSPYFLLEILLSDRIVMIIMQNEQMLNQNNILMCLFFLFRHFPIIYTCLHRVKYIYQFGKEQKHIIIYLQTFSSIVFCYYCGHCKSNDQ